MDTKFGRGKTQHLYGPVVSDLQAVGKRSLEWDLNDWKWDGDRFTATPLNSVDCRSRQLLPVGPERPANGFCSNSSSYCSEDNNNGGGGNDRGKREPEKRRRAVIGVDEEELNNIDDEAGSLHLKLGGQVYPILDGDAKSSKKSKIVGSPSNRAVCQVEDCRADLSHAKDYHRRHKVCDVHSKATKALVGNVMQRFCQQCSRFHALQEFDEGKRSCRRRLAGHNKRRRKTHPDNVVNGNSVNDERSSSYLLISLLRILSNMHSSNSDQAKDRDLLTHLFKNLAGVLGTNNIMNISGLLQGSQSSPNSGTPAGNAGNMLNTVSTAPEPTGASGSTCNVGKSMSQCGTLPASDLIQKRIPSENGPNEATLGRSKINNIDLNNVYDDSQDQIENLEMSHPPVKSRSGLWVQPDARKSSPPQTSVNSDSTSGQSRSSSSGEAQSRTDRIVFKLFGKDPNDLPIGLRRQILEWLSQSPTEIESYIRPGCIILTIYLRLGKPTWEELCCDLGSGLKKLLDGCDDSFWRTGWVYARVQHSMAFIYNGQVILDKPLPLESHKNCKISSIKPIAVPLSERVTFLVKGFNIFQSTTRLLCALEGKYLVQENCCDLTDGANLVNEHDELQYLRVACSVPNACGRGFIEVEDCGLSGCSFPFIVAEREVCSDICMLGDTFEAAETAVDGFENNSERIEALDFIHEMGWLLHRNQLKITLGHLDSKKPHIFPFQRFRWLMEFSMERDWCAVVKKLLCILFDGTVDTREHTSFELASLDMGLLHTAVRRNCRSMVELLLRYAPDNQPVDQGDIGFIFKPDDIGPGGLTPLHVAACCDGAESVLDALTDDPGLVGIEAWSNVRDSTGLTPYDYALARGHYSYIHLVQRKINKKSSEAGHVAVDIAPSCSSMEEGDSKQKPSSSDGHDNLLRVVSLQTEKIETRITQQSCRVCEQRKLNYGNRGTTSLVYKPAMLSMVAIAAVCVCVALLFKSSPEVLYVLRPFRWEHLEYGIS